MDVADLGLIRTVLLSCRPVLVRVVELCTSVFTRRGELRTNQLVQIGELQSSSVFRIQTGFVLGKNDPVVLNSTLLVV